MQQGLDAQGYDCSGFVIASFCDVLAIKPQAWPRELRHVAQMSRIAVAADFQPLQLGDIVLSDVDDLTRAHAAILVDKTDTRVIHATKAQARVVQHYRPNHLDASLVLSVSKILQLIDAHESGEA